jgi:serine/threonine protein kinase
MILVNCTGGSFFDKMKEILKTLSEKEAAKIFKQILSVIAYLHSKGIV